LNAPIQNSAIKLKYLIPVLKQLKLDFWSLELDKPEVKFFKAPAFNC